MLTCDVLMLKTKKMGRLRLRIAFDVVDDGTGEVVASNAFPNGLEVPLAVDEVTSKDCHMLEMAIKRSVARFTASKYLFHLFGIYQGLDENQVALSDIAKHKVEGRFFECSLRRIELEAPRSTCCKSAQP